MLREWFRSNRNVGAQPGSTQTGTVAVTGATDSSATDASGFTPLVFAAWEANHQVIKSLLDAGAKVDDGGPGKASPLFYAVSSHRTAPGPRGPVCEADVLRSVQVLLAAGADPSMIGILPQFRPWRRGCSRM